MKKINNLKNTNWLDKIGYLFKKYLLDESILTNITLEFDKNKIDKKLIDEIIDKTGLSEFINKLPENRYKLERMVFTFLEVKTEDRYCKAPV